VSILIQELADFVHILVVEEEFNSIEITLYAVLRLRSIANKQVFWGMRIKKAGGKYDW